MIKLNLTADTLLPMSQSEINSYIDSDERETVGGEIKCFLIGGVKTICAVTSGSLFALPLYEI